MLGIEVDNGEIFAKKNPCYVIVKIQGVLVDPKLCKIREDCET